MQAVQLRDFATDKHRSVDDTPAVAARGWCSAQTSSPRRSTAWPMGGRCWRPRGGPLTQSACAKLAASPGVTVLCGRFEVRRTTVRGARHRGGVDRRLYPVGGEMGALVLLDACVRLLPGVMGAASSGDDEELRAGSSNIRTILTPIWEGRTIPQVLRSGDHAKIDA